MIGPVCSALHLEHVQSKAQPADADGAVQFDEPFIGQSQGMNMGYFTSVNLGQDAHFQTSSAKLLARIPTYDAGSRQERELRGWHR